MSCDYVECLPTLVKRKAVEVALIADGKAIPIREWVLLGCPDGWVHLMHYAAVVRREDFESAGGEATT